MILIKAINRSNAVILGPYHSADAVVLCLSSGNGIVLADRESEFKDKMWMEGW
jgi:hypothetical protein